MKLFTGKDCKSALWELNEAMCFISSSVLIDSLALRNPLLLQVPKPCGYQVKPKKRLK